jgi:hypothetical protein
MMITCRVAQVTTSAYYEWKLAHRDGTTEGRSNETLLGNQVVDLHADDETCGGHH